MTDARDTEIKALLKSIYSDDQYLPTYPEWWLDPMDQLNFQNISDAEKEEIRLELGAGFGLRDGNLMPFAEYLWHSKSLNIPGSLREMLLGMLVGDAGYRHRIQVAKHPDLRRRPKSVAEVQKRRRTEVLIIRSFIEGGGLDHFESGVNHALANHPTGRKVGWSTVASVMTSRRMKAARDVRDNGETFSEQVVSAFIQEANKDELWSWQKFAESVLRQLEPDDDTDTPF